MIIRKLTLLCSLLIVFASFGQRQPNQLILSGTILGYSYDGSKSLFKNKNEIEIAGSLSGADFKVLDEVGKKVHESTTGFGGEFQVKLPLGTLYTCSYHKSGYGTSAFEIDLRAIENPWKTSGLLLQNIEVLLNKTETEKPQDNGESFGRIIFKSSSAKFSFLPTEFDQKKRLFKNTEDNTGVNLMQRSLDKNKDMNSVIEKTNIIAENDLSVVINTADSTGRIISAPTDPIAPYRERLVIFENIVSDGSINEERITVLSDQIEQERLEIQKDRENAISALDFLQIEARENILAAAERELAVTEAYMQEQREKISAHNTTIILLSTVIILFLALVVALWILVRRKKPVAA